ncbi:MAG: hypothetical protein JO218_18815 [Burkholderiales bacterium]|nr:hypothetical protein [Burkholderiales bacterium]
MRHLALVLWPSFLVSGIFTGLLFAFVDPAGIELAGQPIGLTRMGGYAAAFFALWMFGCGCTALALMLEHYRGDHPRHAPAPHPH